MRTTAFRASLVIAAIYGYFLIFAQFSLVEILRPCLAVHPQAPFSPATAEKLLLGSMAVAGILSGFGVAWKGASPWMIRVALVLGALASLVAPWAGGLVSLLGVAVITGIAIGVSTVTAATLMRSWCGLWWVGLGTGIGYACCNLPVVFSQPPEHQAWIASGFAMIGAICVPGRRTEVSGESPLVFPFPLAVLLFTALVWLDSAAFFIIQHTQELKSGTWNPAQLWRNAAIHLTAALLAGLWLKRGGAKVIFVAAWAILAGAALAVNLDSGRGFAGWMYPAAVSLYSTALVAWPGWFSGAANPRAVAWRAAWIYAVAGWFGSANGIGMAQSLQRVPREFIFLSGACVVAAMVVAWRKNRRIAAVVVLVSAIGFWPTHPPTSRALTSFERGRQVYLSEGCIHCHSQYVRPGTLDDDYWGPVQDRGKVLSARPVIIGNRRQGPDLSNIGARRSATWLKQHFIRPEAFSPGTPMPTYAHLFTDSRGDDLVAFMKQSGVEKIPGILEKASKWQPEPGLASNDGAILFASQCAGCHGSSGHGNGLLAASLDKPPANLVDGPFVWSPDLPDRQLRIARIIKFGIPGTDMPGHETLTDSQILALRNHVSKLRK